VALKGRLSAFIAYGGECLAGREEAAVTIQDVRIAVAAVARFVEDPRQRIGPLSQQSRRVTLIHGCGRAAWMSRATTSTASTDEATLFESVIVGRGRRPRSVWLAALYDGQELASAAGRMLLPNLKDGLDKSRIGAMSVGLGGTGAIREPVEALVGKMVEPLVAGFATGVVEPAGLGEIEEASLVILQEMESSFHGCCLSPGHQAPPDADYG